jgi:hypothetical protein
MEATEDLYEYVTALNSMSLPNRDFDDLLVLTRGS